MQFNYQHLDLPIIEQIIDFTPLKVSPQTPIIDVIALMGEVRHRSCDLINSNLIPSSSSGCCERVDCALIMEGEELKGIFTEQDLVRVAAMDINLSETPIARVMTQKVITLTHCQTQTIFTVLSLLRQHKIRHLPIVNDRGELVGLISASFIRQVLQPSHLLKLWRVSEVMVKQVIHAPKTASVLKLAQLMANLRISCVVIVESDLDSVLKPVGIITERDIVQFKLLELNLGQIEAQGVMSHPLFCLKPSDSLWLAQQEMQHRHVRRLVVTGEQGELQGIVTQSSFLQVFDPVELSSMIAILQGVVAQKTSELAQSNEELNQEINQRLQVETQLRQAQEQLEKRVEERTAELSRTNQRLQQEINERQRIEEKIREQAELINITTDAICVYNLCDQIIFCNQGAERLYDWSREEVLGKKLQNCLRMKPLLNY